MTLGGGRVVPADPPGIVAPLLEAYLTAHLEDVRRVLGVTLPASEVLAEDLAQFSMFAPPTGALLLALVEEQPVGCVGVRSAHDGQRPYAEIKRLYVSPAGRGRGLGRALLRAALAAAKDLGHDLVRLDTFETMIEARALYAAEGFRTIGPYHGGGGPEAFRSRLTFMERDI